MGYRYTLFILWFSMSLMASAQTVKGLVKDQLRQQGLKNVSVILHETGQSVRTDKDGYYELTVPKAGFYEIEFQHPLYRSFRKTVQLKTEKVLEVDPQLKATEKLSKVEYHQSAFKHSDSDLSTPISISHFTLSDFYQRAPRTVAEGLVGMPGYTLIKSHHAGGAPLLRGLNGNRVAVFMDGIRLNSPIGSELPYFNMVDPFLMNQAEILRGSYGTLYGNGAIGGAINLSSRNPEFSSNGLSISPAAMSKYMGQDMELSWRGELEISTPGIAFLGGFTDRQFGNVYTPSPQGEVANTGYDENAMDAKLRMRVGKRHTLTFAYQRLEQQNIDYHTRLSSTTQIYRDKQRSRELAYARLTAYYNSKWVNKLEVSAARQRYANEREIKTAPTDLSTWNHQSTAWTATVEIHSRPNSYWRAVSGLEWNRDYIDQNGWEDSQGEAIRGSIIASDLQGALSQSVSLYSLHTVDLLKLRLHLGGRANAYTLNTDQEIPGPLEISPGAFSGHIAALYPIHRYHNLYASLRAGYRLPNFQDIGMLGGNGNEFVVAGDSLLTEKAITTEIGVKSRTESFSGTLALYRTRLDQLIRKIGSTYMNLPVYQGMRVMMLSNEGQAYVQGLEAEVELPIDQVFAIYGNLNYTFGQDVEADAPLDIVPPLNGRLGLQYQNRTGFWSKAEWLYAANQIRLSPSDILNPQIAEGGSKGWNVINLLAGYNFRWFSLAAGLQNLFNETYRMHGSVLDGYGFSVWASFRLRM